MDIFSFIQLFGGLAFFLFGMTLLSSSLEKMTGGKLEKMLQKVTDNPFKGLLFGAIITIAIQSSSAMTVMLVGFVNSGIMELGQTIGVIMGSNIGTTLTAWILSLAGISSSNPFIKILNPEYFSPVFALVGTLMIMLSKRQKRKDIGTMLVGFSILMTGMNMMSAAVSPLKDMPEFTNILTAFTNPLVGVLVGTLVTGIIQSSAASVGILQALSLTGKVTYGMAIPIIMGQNIGTCVTALISSIGVNRNAKRVAVVHISFNIIGTVVWLSVFYILNAIFKFSFIENIVNPVGIAAVHSIFNLLTTALLFPFTKVLERLACMIVHDSKEDKLLFLDERLLATPTIALAEVDKSMLQMVELTEESLDKSIGLLKNFDEETMEFVVANEKKIDSYEDHIGAYLLKLGNGTNLSAADTSESSKLLHGINEFERIADHAYNLAKAAEELHEKEISFSSQAQSEEGNLLDAIRDIYGKAFEAYRNDNLITAREVEPLQGVIDVLCATLKETHVERLQRGICSAVQGFIFNDIITNCERISDHSMNIAVSVLRVSSVNKDAHAYLHDLKDHHSAEYENMYENFYEVYMGREKAIDAGGLR
ncbi:MAG TPA: Na/Pi cotransporter family protein [Lachnospiraceae bacterium]|nr:Na/Pi cotransporter family protein [Lachnospiraceae bacterium]